jgi:tRNA threonylcarbamoyl adenosine modification protein YeaZ
MRILALDAAGPRCSVALVVDGCVIGMREAASPRGQQAILAPMLAEIMALLVPGETLDAVAATIGPGSFTGLRSALSLAHGIACGTCPVLGVTVAEALAEQVGPLGGRVLWTAIDSRRGRIFLDTGDTIRPFMLDALPDPQGPVAIAGDAAIPVAAILAGRGFDVRLTDARVPNALAVASVGLRRLLGDILPRDAMPLYIDAPEAKLPAGGLRPHPVA